MVRKLSREVPYGSGKFRHWYWCEWCEKEFGSFKETKTHEETCFKSKGMTNMFDNFDKDFYGDITEAKKREKYLDYSKAIEIYEKIGEHEEAARVRKLKAEQGAVKVDQTVVHGDYVDDRDTIVKDSVVNRSNIGAGSDDKFARLEKLTKMKEKGLIDDSEFKQMKKEILGK